MTRVLNKLHVLDIGKYINTHVNLNSVDTKIDVIDDFRRICRFCPTGIS